MGDADGRYVTVLNNNDVLFGRGSGPNDHEGNIKFRELVSQRKSEYMATNHRQTKAKIARAIVDSVFASNGRFLKKVESAEAQRLGLPNGIDAYVVVDDDTIMEKAKQALRQNREKAQGGKECEVPKVNRVAASPRMQRTQPIGAPDVFPSSDSYTQYVGASAAGSNQTPFAGQIPEPDPVRMVNPVPAYSSTIHNEDQFATYTTQLADEDKNSKLMRTSLLSVQDSQGGSRRDSMSIQGGSRRSNLLGGRRESAKLDKRESIKIDEVWRRDSMMGTRAESMQMSELMESFRGMSTTGEGGEYNSSTDTIGTIDPMVMGNNQMSGLSNMSLVSMSSTHSLFKTGSLDHDNEHESETDSEQKPQAPENRAQVMASFKERSGSEMSWGSSRVVNTGNVNGGAGTRESFAPGELWNPKIIHNLMSAPIQESGTMSSANMSSVNMASINAGDPRSLESMRENPDSLSGLGNSSLSVMRASGYDNSGNQRSSGLFGNSSTQPNFDINNSRTPGRT